MQGNEWGTRIGDWVRALMIVEGALWVQKVVIGEGFLAGKEGY